MRWLGVLGVALIALLAVAGGAWLARVVGPGDDAPRLEGPAALLPAVVRSPEPWARWGVPALVAATLERTPAVSVIPLERVRTVLARRDLHGAGAALQGAERERARRLVGALGAKVVVDLELGRTGDGRVALDVGLWGADGSRLHAHRIEDGDLAGAVERLVVHLGDVLGGGTRTALPRDALSGDPWVDRLWAAGVARRAAGTAIDAAIDAAVDACGYFAIASLEAPRFLEARARRLDCLLGAGHLEAARATALELIQSAQARGARDLQAAGFETLSALEEEAGRLTAARGQLEQAARLYGEHGDLYSRARVLEEQASLATREREHDVAIARYREALDLRSGLGDRLGQTETLVRLGRLLLDAPTPREDVAAQREAAAEQALEQASELSEALDDPWLARNAADAMGDLAWRLGDARRASFLWRRALELFRGEEDRRRELSLLRRIAIADESLGDLASAEDLSHEQAELAEALDDRPAAADAAVRLARLQLRLGYPKQARRHLEEALALDRWLDDRDDLQRVIAWTAYERGSYALAVTTLERLGAQAPGRFTAEDRAFLAVYRRAAATGERQPVPGESDGEAAVPARPGRT